MILYTYLALGDSYTIGEGVLLSESFPYQTVQILRQTPLTVANPFGGLQIEAPQIIAQTGWTTDELDAAINAAAVTKQYDIVSLLIGVNNQYRGRTVSDFNFEFERLLQRAIQFAGNKPNHVFVFSIPDWGITPFGEARLPDGQERDSNKIAAEIDAYNNVCKAAATQQNCEFIDITTSQRQDGNKREFLAADGLHPSGKEYAKWAALLAEKIILKM